MNRTEAYFLNLLGAFVNNTKPTESEEIDDDELYKLSRIHSVSGIIGYLAKNYKIVESPEISGKFKNDFMKTACMQVTRNYKMNELMSHLTENNIDHILFKGFVIKECYQIPELRTFGDVDFVIHEADRDKCHELMIGLGYTFTTNYMDKVYGYAKDMENYEIHTSVMTTDITPNADYIGYFQNMWENVVLIEGKTYQFSKEFHFIYLISHIAKHINSSGAGIRMYMDIALFCKCYGDSFDWIYINEQLRELHLDKFFNVVMLACEKWFGVKSIYLAYEIDGGLFEDFTKHTLSGGVFGFVGEKRRSVNKMRTVLKNDANATRLKVFFSAAFPSSISLEKKYGYLNNKHFLLPVAWIHRFIKSFRKSKKIVKEINNMDVAAAKKQDKLLKSIGL